MDHGDEEQIGHADEDHGNGVQAGERGGDAHHEEPCDAVQVVREREPRLAHDGAGEEQKHDAQQRVRDAEQGVFGEEEDDEERQERQDVDKPVGKPPPARSRFPVRSVGFLHIFPPRPLCIIVLEADGVRVERAAKKRRFAKVRCGIAADLRAGSVAGGPGFSSGCSSGAARR